MKKIIASAVVAMATLSASQAAVFNGASVGLAGGTNIFGIHAKGDGQKVKNHKTFGLYGLHFVYEISKANSTYFGLGLDVQGFAGALKFKEDDGKTTVKQRISSQLDARLGYNFCGHTVAYGLVGGRVFNIRTKHTDVDPAESYKDSDTRFAPVLGLGVATKVADKVSIGLEYRYSFDRTIKDKEDGSRAKLRTQQVLAKVSYHF